MSRIFLALLFAGCATTGNNYKFSITAEQQATGRAPDCSFRVVNVAPQQGYNELGVLDYDSGDVATKIDEFKTKIHAQVCQAGGDLVVAEINGFGSYVRGIVFVKAPNQQASAQ
jgi:hypothetical protein